MGGRISTLKRYLNEESSLQLPSHLLSKQIHVPKITPEEFKNKWKPASNLKERSTSQSHFNDICALIGEKTPIEDDPEGIWYAFEKGASKVGGGKGWADVWKKGCFAWEYKGKHKDLVSALGQLQRYAIALDNPPLLVVCNIETIIIHTNFNSSIHEEHRITLDDLDSPEALQKLKWLFTAPNKLRPEATTETITNRAAAAFAKVAQRLRDQGYDGRRVAHFMTKLTFCMFAEDIGILPNYVFKHTIEAALKRPESFDIKMKKLFEAMKSGGAYGYVDIPWFNGGLFDDDDALPLDQETVREIYHAALLDWSQIEPSIFGTLFERGLDPSKRSQVGAHYTDPGSIKRIINPVIKEPLETEWNRTKREIESLLAGSKPSTRDKIFKKAEAKYELFLKRLCNLRVLDSACGSGNYLYLALVELKNLEHRVRLEGEVYGFHRSFNEIGPQNVIGIEINDYAAELARVTIWIGEIQWMIRNGFGSPQNPVLKRLDHIENRDALINPDGTEAEWPVADFIIGNPPFLGSQRMLGELGEHYVMQLRRLYDGRVPGGADLVTFWHEKARTAIANGNTKRAGLVSTNSIRGGANRTVLERIRKTGRIFCAWSDEPWVNEGAAVRVSMVCFDGGVGEVAVMLNGQPVADIYPDLTARREGAPELDLTTAHALSENKGIAFQGPVKVGSFDIPGQQARQWLNLPSNPNGRCNCDVVRPWSNGMDITRRPSDTWIVDFASMSEADAALYEAPFEYVQETIKPERENNNREGRRLFWWRHGETVPALRSAVEPLTRYIATPRVTKHRIFVWLDSSVLPDSRLYAIARNDDTTFGILHSRFHEIWSLRTCSWHGVGNDPTYNSASCFETFPFPAGLTPNIPADRYANDHRAKRIAAASRELAELREKWLNPPEWVHQEPEVVPGYPDRMVPANEHAARELKKRTLTNLYNMKPQWLVKAHRKLDEAVAAVYGWDAEISDEEVLRRLLELNQRRAVAAVVPPTKAKRLSDINKKPTQRSFVFSYKGGRKSQK